VGFFQGAALRDPARLLQGSGKFMRHVKLRPGAVPDAASLRGLIAAAYLDIKARVENGEGRRGEGRRDWGRRDWGRRDWGTGDVGTRDVGTGDVGTGDWGLGTEGLGTGDEGLGSQETRDQIMRRGARRGLPLRAVQRGPGG
jgi:hypothetical protein